MTKYAPLIAALLGLISAPVRTNAQVTVYTDLGTWQAALTSTTDFLFTSSNLATANEVGSAPANNTALSSPLTFDSSNTGLGASFTITALEAGAGFVYNESISGGDASWQQDTLSIGGTTAFDDDDFQIQFTDTMVSGVAFNFVNSQSGGTFDTGETMQIWNGGSLVDTLIESDFPSADGKAFFGIVSTTPFDKIIFDEATDAGNDDDIGIADLRYGTVIPEPSTYAFIVGALSLGMVVWRRLSKRR